MKVKGSSLLAVWLLVPGLTVTCGGDVMAREYHRTTALTDFNAYALGKNMTRLEVGKEISRQLAAGETDTYQVSMKAGQYMHVSVEQVNIDAVVKVFAPNGKLIAAVDDYYAPLAQKALLVAEITGNYRVEISRVENNSAPGRYKVSIKELRTATAQEKNRFAAERAYAEGEQLYREGTSESLRLAIEKYKQALPLYRAVDDKNNVARTLNNIGFVYDALGEKQQALNYYNQSLPLRRAVGDRAGEARTLNNIGAVYNALGEKQQALNYYNQSLPLPLGSERSGGGSHYTE